MYIRRITTKLADGSRVGYLQLAHKVRHPETGVPTDEVLYHIGREDQLDPEQLKRLARSISRFLEPADQAEIEARLEGLGDEGVVEKSLSWGGSYLLDAVWKRLELDQVLQGLLRRRSHSNDLERLIFALVARRALSPSSKLAMENWVGEEVWIEDLGEVSVHALYRAMDFLAEHDEEIQQAVYFSVATLLNLEVDLLFFDTTSTYFEVEEEDELRRWGHSKDRRRDLPQIVIGLAVTREGIPVRCWVLPGNTNDASTIEAVQADLAGWKLNRVVWVVDRGMGGEEQRLALQRGGGHVIMGEKLRSGAELPQTVLSHPGRYRKVRENLEVKEVVLEEGSERRRYVLVRNPEQAERDRHKRQQLLERLEQEINALNPGIGKRGGKHSKSVCALTSHPSMGRYLRELKSGQLRIDHSRVRQEEKLDGKYLLYTSDHSLSAEDVALGYRQLLVVEDSFRTLKSTLELRPVYHRLEDRIRAHVLLCWMALLLVRVIENQCEGTWRRIRREMSKLHRVIFLSKDGVVHLTSRLTAEQRNILKDLKIDPPRPVYRIETPA
ncbi:IS1634 family transposase [Gemmatimonadota bacterium]